MTQQCVKYSNTTNNFLPPLAKVVVMVTVSREQRWRCRNNSHMTEYYTVLVNITVMSHKHKINSMVSSA